MSKLSDSQSNSQIGYPTAAQRNALSHAAQRADGALTLSGNLRGKAAERLAASLISKGLVREVRAKAGMPVWRRDDKGGRRALIITSFGRAAINAGEADTANTLTAGSAQISSSASGTRLDTTSSIDVRSRSPRARKAASTDSAMATKPGASRTRYVDSRRPRPNEPDNISEISAAQPSPEAPRPGSKLAAVIALLQGEAGSSIEELSAVTGWLPHTTRAALTSLRKRGYVVERLRLDEGSSTYRIMRLTSSIAA